jgi:hypothetical protein
MYGGGFVEARSEHGPELHSYLVYKEKSPVLRGFSVGCVRDLREQMVLWPTAEAHIYRKQYRLFPGSRGPAF